jgi:hypothetical protein
LQGKIEELQREMERQYLEAENAKKGQNRYISLHDLHAFFS